MNTDARVYVDTEYCYPGMKRGTPRPSSADLRQIVQVAAVLVDTSTGSELAHFDQLARPTFDELLPEFFVELTGITQADVDKAGAPFEEVFAHFVQFCDLHPIWTFDKDEEVLRQNCGFIGQAWPFSEAFVRVRSRLPRWDIDPDAYSSGTLHKAAGAEPQGRLHNALNDVRSMADAVSRLEASHRPNRSELIGLTLGGRDLKTLQQRMEKKLPSWWGEWASGFELWDRGDHWSLHSAWLGISARGSSIDEAVDDAVEQMRERVATGRSSEAEREWLEVANDTDVRKWIKSWT